MARELNGPSFARLVCDLGCLSAAVAEPHFYSLAFFARHFPLRAAPSQVRHKPATPQKAPLTSFALRLTVHKQSCIQSLAVFHERQTSLFFFQTPLPDLSLVQPNPLSRTTLQIPNPFLIRSTRCAQDNHLHRARRIASTYNYCHRHNTSAYRA